MIATMTIIIAQKTTTGVLLAADNHSHDGQRRTLKATPKLVQISPRVAYGTSGHTRLANILRENVGTFPMPDKYDDLKDRGIALNKYECDLGAFFRGIVKGEYPESKIWTIVAIDDQIFDVGYDGGLIRVADEFTATGVSELVALGALYALYTTIESDPSHPHVAKSNVKRSLEACAAFIDSIRPPWSFVETKKPA